MQFSHVLITLAVATLVNASQLDIPSCAVTCLVNGLASDGCSDLADWKCHCSTPDLVRKIIPCANIDCPVTDRSNFSSVLISQCSTYGVPITIPTTTITILPTTRVYTPIPYYPPTTATRIVSSMIPDPIASTIASPSPTTSSTISLPLASTMASQSPIPQPEQKAGLATGARVGIGVGVAIVTTLTWILAFILWRRNRRTIKHLRQQLSQIDLSREAESDSNVVHPPELTPEAIPERVSLIPPVDAHPLGEKWEMPSAMKANI